LIVIDASAQIELLLRTELGAKVEVRVLAAEERLHAPHLLDVEIAQVLRRLLQLKQITASRAKEALDDHLELFIERTSPRDLLQRIWELRELLTAYDATYIALAEALDAPVVTCDAKLARAHGHHATIELIQ
jgi:predicted nucleic acid-binding protein